MVRSKKLVTAILMAAIQGDAARRRAEGKARRLLTTSSIRRSAGARTCLVKASKAKPKNKRTASQRLACLCGMGLLQAWRLTGYRKTRSIVMLRA